ncbi:MAG: polysaccharide biosynthesis C-terminal domain-containing protein [Lachnospiraceae bacterium]|nr:polysaccharide biosynthesis C-terminal domain-containing protein [Lachnospiraceae bacterium]
MKLYKEFFRYVIPSMLAFALSGLYGIVDGFFLGNEMGDAALAAINVAYPITAFVQALGTGIGMGGAVQYTIHKAQKKKEDAARCLGLTLLLLLGSGVIITPILLTMNIPMLKALGLQGELLALGNEYIIWIAWGTLFQILGTGLVPFMRNLGNAYISTVAMVIGAMFNIVFDYLLIWVFHQGMKGAAIASVMGQVAAFVVSICYVYWKKERVIFKRIPASLGKKILLVACSPFGLSFAPNITLILVNLNAVAYGGEFAVTCYAPISYITYTIMLLLQGISDGCQPLVSLFYGKGEEKDSEKIYKMSRNFSIFVGILFMLFVLWQGRMVVGIFGSSPQVTEYVLKVLPIFLLGMAFSGISRAVISYFYATEKNMKAYILIYGEAVLLGILLLILPRAMGIMGTWMSIMLSQILVAVMSQALLKMKFVRKEK